MNYLERLRTSLPAASRHSADYVNGLRQKSSFLKGNSGLLVIWPIVAVLIATVGWGSLLQGMEQQKREIEETALKEAATLAHAYAGQLERTIEAVDQILLHVRYEWELTNGKLRLEDSSQRGLLPRPTIFNIGITDFQGNILTNAPKISDAISVSDRPFFYEQKNSPEDTLYVSHTTQSKSTGQSVINFSRKVFARQKQFDGVVRVSVTPEYLTTSYNDVALSANGFIATLSTDRMLLASRIGDKVFGLQNHPLIKIPSFAKSGGSMLLKGSEWFTDGRSRYIGWQKLDNLPLIAMTGMDKEDMLSQFSHSRDKAIAQALLNTMVLAAFTLAAMGLSLRLAWRKHQVNLTQAAYRIATESGNEGFFICRPIYDRNQSVVDFELLDCNENGAYFYRRQRRQLLGTRLSELYPADQFEYAFKRLSLAMERGVFEDDVKISPASKVPQWFYLKVIRSEDVLAVTMRDITESKAHMLALERKGNEDALTKLPNRHWFNAYLPEAIARATEQKTMLALLFIDLDGFKTINDTLGHDAGDELLRNASRRLTQAVRPHDHVVRIGGDEFLVIIEVMEQKKDAAQVAYRVLHAFDKSFNLSKGKFSVGASIGISVYPDDGKDAETLLKHADIAMYSVKTSGKRNYRFFDQRFYEAVRARHDKEAELRHALEHDQLILYYQPRVEISSGRLSSMEALVRWAHPTKGLIEPLDFIPLAEETGLIMRLGEIVIEKVCAQLAYWIRSGQEVVPVSINVSARQFNETRVADILGAALKRHGIAPTLVEIELTESSMTGGAEEVRESLDAIQKMGVNLSVDDFGTGYSSLSQLQRLDFDVLKVDRAFTAELEKTKEGEVFFTAIITMAHALGMRVVAEGVETIEQMRKLKELRCDEVQGFYISKPLPPTERQPKLPKHLSPLLT